jgi:dihydroorotate dehydrogenase (fumarate)
MHSGPAHITTLRDEIAEWMEEHEYESLEQMRGCMNFLRCPRPERYARANYMKVLGSS